MSETMPDVEGAMRTWLRAQSGIQAVVAQRVFFGIPRNATESDFPMITVARVGGGDDQGDVPVDRALMQISCWGSIDTNGNPLKSTATAVVNAVRSAVRGVRGKTELTASVDAFGINVESVVWLPDPNNDRPRYVVTVDVTAISS